MQAQLPDLTEQPDFEIDDSLNSDDSSDADLNSATYDTILKAIRATPFGNSAICFANNGKTDFAQSKCLCSNCIYTGQETFDTSYGERNPDEDRGYKHAYEKLLIEHKKSLSEVSELRVFNRSLAQDKIRLAISLKNSEKQLAALLESLNVRNIEERIRFKTDGSAVFKQFKDQSEQRLDFCNKKLEQYIVKVEHQESVIDDLKFKLSQALKRSEIETCALILKLVQKPKGNQRLNMTDAYIQNVADTSFIAKMKIFRENQNSLSKQSNTDHLLMGIDASTDDLFTDCEISGALARFNNLQGNCFNVTHAKMR